MGARRDKLNNSGSTYHEHNVAEWPPELANALVEKVRGAKPNTSLNIVLAEFASERRIPLDQVMGKWDQIRAEHERLRQLEQDLRKKSDEYAKMQKLNKKGLPWLPWEIEALTYYSNLNPQMSRYAQAQWYSTHAPHRSMQAARTKLNELGESTKEANEGARQVAATSMQLAIEQAMQQQTPLIERAMQSAPSYADTAVIPEDRYPPMTLLKDCMIYNIGERGVFVRLPNNTSCFVHLSEMSDAFVDSPANFCEFGQRVDVMILEYDSYGRPKASIKRAKPLQKRSTQLSAVPRVINTGKYMTPQSTTVPTQQPAPPPEKPVAAEAPSITTNTVVAAPVSAATTPAPKPIENRPAAEKSEDTVTLPADTARILLALAALVEDGLQVLEDIEVLRSAVKASKGSSRDLLRKLFRD